MPWTAEDALRHTKLATDKTSQRQWMHVANGVLSRTGDEGKAIEAANSVIEKRHKKANGDMADPGDVDTNLKDVHA